MANANTSIQQNQQQQSQSQQQQQQQHFQVPQQPPIANNSTHHCKECGLLLNSAESLDVHLQYHKENLLNKWATQAAGSHSEETNNNHSTGASNNTKSGAVKREFVTNNTITAADSSDSMTKKSPDYNSRTTPETIFGHPPTPQSYQSASSPYQNHDNSAFSPNFQNFATIKPERVSPNYHQTAYGNFDAQFYQTMEPAQQNQQFQQDFPIHKSPMQQTSFRYHPYPQSQHSSFDRVQSNSQVSSSSPAYPPQPTPSPSPKQCDKCGYVCDSASQLVEHLNLSHPPTPAPPHLSSYHSNQQHFIFNNDPNQQSQIKGEEDAQSEILDLDSHKVHQVYPEEEKRQNGEMNLNPHSVTAMLNSWQASQQKLFPQESRMFMQGPDQKMFQTSIGNNLQEQKLFQTHAVHAQDYMSGGTVTTTTQDNLSMAQQSNYRPFEHLPSQSNNPTITSSQVPSNAPQNTPSPNAKSTNWKSNEARRPKTYNCTACNKWFTSSGHLKRHYNTTLHKNAVKSSGQPDPATLPISAHHHPSRESTSSREDRNSSPGDESRGEDTNSLSSPFDRTNVGLPGLLQQPPNGPYDRQPTAGLHHTPPLHSPMPPNLVPPPMSTNTSPPNGDAGLSPSNLDTRGLLSLSTTPNSAPPPAHGFNMGPIPTMMPIENAQFQMYPNGLAPHVTQAMVTTNNLNITGEFHQLEVLSLEQHHQASEQPQPTNQPENEPLPSFAQIQQTPRYGLFLSYGNVNVGGGGPVTAPSYYPNDPYEMVVYRTAPDDYGTLADLSVGDPAPTQEEDIVVFTQRHDSISEELRMDSENVLAKPQSPEKAHTKRDFEENPSSPRISSTVATTKQLGVHRCNDCDKQFNKACYLTQHNKTFHSGDKPFKCGRCGKRFSCEGTYNEHLTKHAGDKPHKCDQCPKQFNHKTDLRRHMCLHTGQKPYSCDTCGKGFIRKDHMLKHCETHTRKHSKIVALR